ncbi:structural maintenance of chromosomes protein 6B-like isoform X1 [Macadamia integrifolia]|uniref:structural maintenance of chromosomes protein 6B-like isoform X1 n=3 Tax=Macadamia integrifolia TaxID=60698 RepID=UPI001C4FC6DD|nr:structural maintenance of chromosomes protein 6B-like isoform X1 [Macadamia integrifolia]
MSQDKSREFLHSGNDKEKFKFFYKATLLEQLNDRLQDVKCALDSGNERVNKMEASIRPILNEVNELDEKIKKREQIEETSQRLEQLSKMLAWLCVYEVDGKLQEVGVKLEKLKERIPTCQAKIDYHLGKEEELKALLAEKNSRVASMMEKTSEVRRLKDEYQHNISMARRKMFEIDDERNRKIDFVQKMVKQAESLERQISDFQEEHARDTQAEECKREEHLKGLQDEANAAYLCFQRWKEEEGVLSEALSGKTNECKEFGEQIEGCDRKHREALSRIRELQQNQTNKVTAFGGEIVIRLLRVIEKYHRRFTRPPIGPIGAHLALVNGDMWAPAVENAIGRFLNAFIVNDHKDFLLLRECAKEVNYHRIRIYIYDFSIPRLNIPRHMLPQTQHPTTLSVLHADNPTILNVLVDMGSAESQVLVRDYEVGKSVTFEQRIPNLREVYTLDGYKMFCRGAVQTTLPPNRKSRNDRLRGSYEDQIKDLEKKASMYQEEAQQLQARKRVVVDERRDLDEKLRRVKRLCLEAGMDHSSKQYLLDDAKSSYAAEASSASRANVDDLSKDYLKAQDQIGEQERLIADLQMRRTEVELTINNLKSSFENLCESAKVDSDAFDEAERELVQLKEELCAAEKDKAHYEMVMRENVLRSIKAAEEEYKKLQLDREDKSKKASIICPENEVKALACRSGNTRDELNTEYNKLKRWLQHHESDRDSESIDDLRLIYQRKKRKISAKQHNCEAFREKFNELQKALDLRWSKFQRNANLSECQLTWQFNGHLRKKGFSGRIKVNYEEKTLSIVVKMPQDASSKTVRDTRGLSGGERSFSTLCFALALHEMTEAPFRAMDEFDVFMDAVSRKISLDALVDFALAQGSQWIFITPHDISMVKASDRVKKQQMPAPRS